MALLCHMLTSSFFIFGGQFCEQADGVVMRLLLSTVQELLRGGCEESAGSSNPQASYWFRYMDGICVICLHGPERVASWTN